MHKGPSRRKGYEVCGTRCNKIPKALLVHSKQCPARCAVYPPPASFLFVRYNSDWHLGYPDCGLTSQSPINIAADVEKVVEVSPSRFVHFPVHYECARCDSVLTCIGALTDTATVV